MSQAGLRGATLSFDDFRGVFASLTAEEWEAASACAGWRVQEVAAHISSNLKELVEPSPTPAEPPPPMPAEMAMEALVTHRRDWAWQDVHDELERYGDPALAAFAAMQDEPMASTSMPLLDLGEYQLHELADAFAFDLYCHLRNDVLSPRGPVVRHLAPVDEDRLAPAVGWMLAGLPQMCGASLGGLGGTIGLDLTGVAAGSWSIGPVADGSWAVTPRDVPTAVTLRSSATDFVLWGTKREDWRPLVTIDGDRQLGVEFLERLNII